MNNRAGASACRHNVGSRRGHVALIVHKYGGTSVGSTDRIEGVADKVCAAREAGDDVVVVLSAMAGETDRLLALARAISSHGRPNPRELDVLLATGEQVTIALLCMALEKRGVTARSFTGFQAGIRTDASHNKAHILDVAADSLRTQLARARVPVVAGFQGMDHEGNITTLGRGGSDVSAVAIAAALKADECRIYTDVDGVYTADPRIVSDARRLDSLSYSEMLEMAEQGSKVLQSHSVEFARRNNVRLRVLSTFEPGPGTMVAAETGRTETSIVGIACRSAEAIIRLRGIPAGDAESRWLALLAASRIGIDLLERREAKDGNVDIVFTMPHQECDHAVELLAPWVRSAGTYIEASARVAKITAIGSAIGTTLSTRAMEALAAANIVVHQLSSSERRISVVVDEIQMENAGRALHHEFRLHEDVLDVKAG